MRQQVSPHLEGEGDVCAQLLAGEPVVPEALDVQEQAAREAVQAHALGGGGALLAHLAGEGLLPLTATIRVTPLTRASSHGIWSSMLGDA